MHLDTRFMQRALILARKGIGHTSPNPAVGAVLAKEGRILGEGYHRKAGQPHAEVEAIENARGALAGSTLYVTLEPCCHHGRTPPCTEAIIAAGIKKVVVGALDPNPKVAGSGIEALRAAGVEVTQGVMGPECGALNEAYNKHIVTGLPFVILKLATTLDGRTASITGNSRWVTGINARRFVHRMRAFSDAVLVGSSTVAADDPELTVRHVRGRNPLRVVVDSELVISLKARLFDGLGPGRGGGAAGGKRGKGPELLIFTTRAANNEKVRLVRQRGAEVIYVRRSPEGVDLGKVLAELGRRGIVSLLVEGGGTLAASLLKAGLIDKVIQFIAPSYMGGDGLPSVAGLGVRDAAAVLRLGDVKTRRVGEDILVEGYLQPPTDS